MEEKKWMDKLDNNQHKILLYKVPNDKEFKSDTSW